MAYNRDNIDITIIHHDQFDNLGFDIFEHPLSYTKVQMELPYRTDGDFNILTPQLPIVLYGGKYHIQNYQSYYYKSKMPFIKSTLEIYAGGMYTHLLDPSEYICIDYNDNQYIGQNINLYNDEKIVISYTPALSGDLFGDKVDDHFTNNRSISEYVGSNININTVLKARLLVNNIENYIDSIGYNYPPTLWLGGVNNSSKSVANNIIPLTTPISIEHIKELQTAINNIEVYLSQAVFETGYQVTSFQSINIYSKFMIEYIETIYTAIKNIETRLIDEGI
jgi:hypothetical protein